MRLLLAKQDVLSIFQNHLASSILPAVGACGGKKKGKEKTPHEKPETTLMGCLELEVSFFPEGGCLLSPVLSVNQPAGVGSAAPSFPWPLP